APSDVYKIQVLYCSSNIDSYIGLLTDTKMTLLNYCNPKIILNTIGRIDGLWIEDDLISVVFIMEAKSQEREWSYKYIVSIDNRAFFIIRNKKLLEMFIS
ncbi:hypothetical protein AAH976_12955, partial [Enterococcus faecium]|uniref:hypothetical protein n=1 Tax=Enterococcus faecium TaxID=1352 RepID=UPI0031CD7030